MSGHNDSQKRMRKGTRSCLPCRKRKIKCSGTGNNGEPCRECTQRGKECIAQGVVAEGDVLIARLEERVAVLEASLQEAVQSSGHGTPSTIRSNGSGTQHSTNHSDAIDTQKSTSRAVPIYKAKNHQLNVPTAPSVHSWHDGTSGGSPDALAGAFNGAMATIQSDSQGSMKYQESIRELCSCLPSEAEMLNICNNQSSWWELYRGCLGYVWGDGDTIGAFAAKVLEEKKPPTLGLLLVFFAISTGDLHRYLPPVERRIVNDDEYSRTDGGLNCLMALGLCHMASLQPHRAWMVTRRANGLLQLNGIHIRRRTEEQDNLFWELFQADRWVSLMIGLPYQVPDHLCDLTIPPVAEIGAATWLYRQLGIITGHVIDCLQSVMGVTLSAAIQVEEEMESIKSQLSPGYLDIQSIRKCVDPLQKSIRLYRTVHFYQLRSFIHLPFLLRSATSERYESSVKSCTDDARRLLEAYLELYDSNPTLVASAIIIHFNVFICTGILLLGLIGYGRSPTSACVLSPAQLRADWKTFYRVIEVLKHGARDKSVALLCQTCHKALESLLESARGAPGETAKKVVLPYFGTLSITRHEPMPAPLQDSSREWETASCPHDADPSTIVAEPDVLLDVNFGMGMEFTYDGPFLADGNAADWMSWQGGLGFDWHGDVGGQMAADGGWLGSNLSPGAGL